MNESGEIATPPARPASIRYLDTVRATEAARVYKRQSWSRLELRSGDRVLDIGCGCGDDVRDLASTVGLQGRAVGIDSDYQMVAEAWRRLGPRHLNRHIEFRVGDAHVLPFDDNQYDGCCADRVFQHLENPELALREMVRVTRPGAKLVVSDPDWETLTVDGADREITRRVCQFIADHFVRHGWMGRRLHRMFTQQGLQNVHVDPAVLTTTSLEQAEKLWGFRLNAARARDAGMITNDQMAEWFSDLETADEAALFFCAQLGFVASGRKP